MKEASQSLVSRSEPAKRHKKRRGGSNLSNGKRKKEKKQRELKKSLRIEGRGTSASLPQIINLEEGRSWRSRCNI